MNELRPASRTLPSVLIAALLAVLLAAGPTLARAGEPVQPAAACVDDPRADALERWQALLGWGPPLDPEDPWGRAMETRSWPDLDGDGVEEWTSYLSFRCGASGNCDGLLYVSNSGCRRFVGRTFGVQSEPLPTRHNGLADLWSFHRTGCAGARGTVGLFTFDGSEYQLAREVECPCPLDGAPEPPECRLLRYIEPRAPAGGSADATGQLRASEIRIELSGQGWTEVHDLSIAPDDAGAVVSGRSLVDLLGASRIRLDGP